MIVMRRRNEEKHFLTQRSREREEEERGKRELKYKKK